jgi:OOP family OmpA-OmpF porin
MRPGLLFSIFTVAITLGLAACATKRHVREALAPLETQANQTQASVTAVKEGIDQNQERIGDLDRHLSSASEHAAAAETAGRRALDLSARATSTGSEASHRADSASAAARQAQIGLARTTHRMDESLASLGDYHVAFKESIYFGFSQSGISKQEQSKLDLAIRRLRGMRNYVIEVEGFADSAGDASFNRELSRKRADEVVHYLVVQRGVPLRSIHRVGAGADFPHADNQTPTARRENRRVDLLIYSLGPESTPFADGGSHP